MPVCYAEFHLPSPSVTLSLSVTGDVVISPQETSAVGKVALVSEAAGCWVYKCALRKANGRLVLGCKCSHCSQLRCHREVPGLGGHERTPVVGS